MLLIPTSQYQALGLGVVEVEAGEEEEVACRPLQRLWATWVLETKDVTRAPMAYSVGHNRHVLQQRESTTNLGPSETMQH